MKNKLYRYDYEPLIFYCYEKCYEKKLLHRIPKRNTIKIDRNDFLIFMERNTHPRPSYSYYLHIKSCSIVYISNCYAYKTK